MCMCVCGGGEKRQLGAIGVMGGEAQVKLGVDWHGDGVQWEGASKRKG